MTNDDLNIISDKQSYNIVNSLSECILAISFPPTRIKCKYYSAYATSIGKIHRMKLAYRWRREPWSMVNNGH